MSGICNVDVQTKWALQCIFQVEMHIVRLTFVHHLKKINVLFCYWRHLKKEYIQLMKMVSKCLFYFDGHENTIKVLINLHVPFLKTCHTIEERGKFKNLKFNKLSKFSLSASNLNQIIEFCTFQRL